VVERLAEVEEAFAALRWALPEDGSPPTKSQIASKIAALEAASLVAGVPQPVLTCYSVVCKYHEDAHRMSRGTVIVAERVAKMVNDNLVKLRESPNREETVATLKRISESVKKIHDRVKATDDPAFRLHDAALGELSRALWHPILLQFRRRKLRALRQRADQLEKTGRELAASLRSVESLYGQASRGSNSLKAAESTSPENTTPDDAKAATEQK